MIYAIKGTQCEEMLSALSLDDHRLAYNSFIVLEHQKRFLPKDNEWARRVHFDYAPAGFDIKKLISEGHFVPNSQEIKNYAEGLYHVLVPLRPR